MRSGVQLNQKLPLYAYRTSDDELNTLRQALQEVLRIRSDLTREEEAGFCLFAAEWFRRHHYDGVWKWETILAGLNLPVWRQADVRIRTDGITLRGLRWWGRPVVQTLHSYRYLTTLACEGGLPLQVLQTQGSSLWRYFHEVLRRYERYPNLQSIDVAVECNYLLPTTLQNAVVHELTARLIRAITVLRSQSATAEQSGIDRIAYLEQNRPNWRDSVPLRLDDQIAIDLVGGLLRERSSGVAISQLSVLTMLVNDAGRLTLARDLRFEPEIEPEILAEHLGIPASELRPRFALHLVGTGRRVSVATVTLKQGQSPTFRLQRSPHPPISGAAAAGRLRLAAVLGTKDLATVDLPGGESLPDWPWVFEDDEPARLLGVGSLRTRRPAVLVAIPESTTWKCADEGEVTSIAALGRQVLRLAGSLQVFDGDLAIATIRTSLSSAEDEVRRTFELHGVTLTLGPGGTDVWLGLPRVLERMVDGLVPDPQVDLNEIVWRPAHGLATWFPLSSGCLGDVLLRVVRSGQVLYQVRATVFPAAFRFSMRPGPSKNDGTLVFEGLGSGASVHVAKSPGLQALSTVSAGQHMVRVTLTSERPAQITLKFTFENGRSAEVTVACPVPWAAIVDVAGRALPADLPIALSDLDGLRLQVVTTQPSMLEISEFHQGSFHHLAKLPQLRGLDQTYELPLSLVQSQVAGLLARSDDPDGAVSLAVFQNSIGTPLHKFTVSRYPGQLDCEIAPGKSKADLEDPKSAAALTGQKIFSVPQGLIDRYGDRIHMARLDIRPFGHPEQPVPTEVAELIAPGRWQFRSDLCTPGLWLVTAWLDEWTCLRPRRETVSAAKQVVENSPEVSPKFQFDAVLNLTNSDLRKKAWDQLVAEMAISLEHPAWKPMNSLLDTCQNMPVTTFEAVAGITRNPNAAALLGIVRAGDAWLWDRLEQLPFLWSLIPIRAWISAAGKYTAYLRANLQGTLTDEQIASTIASATSRFVDQAVLRSRSMECVLACLNLADQTVIVQARILAPLSKAALPRLIQELEQHRTRLVAEHAGDRWPAPWLPTPFEIKGPLAEISLGEFPAFQFAVLTAPALAAAHSVFDVPLASGTVGVLQALRGFDPDWFDSCHAIAMYRLAGLRLSHDENCFARA